MKQPIFPNPEQPIRPERRKISESDWIIFSDGEIALGHNKPGEVVTWVTGNHKWENIDSPGNVALVSLDSGRTFVFGFRGGAELPKYDKTTGKFGAGSEDIVFVEMDHSSTPDLVIGEPSPELFGEAERIKNVMFQYKIGGPETPGIHQDYPSPFAAIRDMSDGPLGELF